MNYGDKKWREWVLGYEWGGALKPRRGRDQFFDTRRLFAGAERGDPGPRAARFAKRDEVGLRPRCTARWAEPDHAGSRARLLEPIDASLQRLGMDYVDLYIIPASTLRRRSRRPSPL